MWVAIASRPLKISRYAADSLVYGLNSLPAERAHSMDNDTDLSTIAYRFVQDLAADLSAKELDLPGFPDNINNGLNGRFWIGLAAPRNALLDRLSDRPFVRKVVQRLPTILRPKPIDASHVIAIDADGTVLMDLQDPAAKYPLLTGVLETRKALYLTTLVGHRLPWIDKQNLQ